MAARSAVLEWADAAGMENVYGPMPVVVAGTRGRGRRRAAARRRDHRRDMERLFVAARRYDPGGLAPGVTYTGFAPRHLDMAIVRRAYESAGWKILALEEGAIQQRWVLTLSIGPLARAEKKEGPGLPRLNAALVVMQPRATSLF